MDHNYDLTIVFVPPSQDIIDNPRNCPGTKILLLVHENTTTLSVSSMTICDGAEKYYTAYYRVSFAQNSTNNSWG